MTVRRAVFRMPRVLGILFPVSIPLFSLDVFEIGAGFWATLGGFIIHYQGLCPARGADHQLAPGMGWGDEGFSLWDCVSCTWLIRVIGYWCWHLLVYRWWQEFSFRQGGY